MYIVRALCFCRPRLIKLSCRSKQLIIKVRDRNVRTFVAFDEIDIYSIIILLLDLGCFVIT